MNDVIFGLLTSVSFIHVAQRNCDILHRCRPALYGMSVCV